MPLGRKHLRRSRDAPNVGWTIQRTASNLSRTRREVNVPKELDATEWGREPCINRRDSAVTDDCNVAQVAAGQSAFLFRSPPPCMVSSSGHSVGGMELSTT